MHAGRSCCHPPLLVTNRNQYKHGSIPPNESITTATKQTTYLIDSFLDFRYSIDLRNSSSSFDTTP